MKSYRTVTGEGHVEQIIEKSRFIAHIKNVSDKEEGDLFIQEIKKKYKDATHNVPAMVIGDSFQIQWASDDGEPQGTSGAPMVQMLVNEGITNVVLVVTRFFGGIKLGTGGLVRAYTGSAKLALDSVEHCLVQEMMVLMFKVEYGDFNKIKKNFESMNEEICKVVYGEKVEFEILCPPEKESDIIKKIANITNGVASLTGKKSTIARIKIEK